MSADPNLYRVVVGRVLIESVALVTIVPAMARTETFCSLTHRMRNSRTNSNRFRTPRWDYNGCQSRSNGYTFAGLG